VLIAKISTYKSEFYKNSLGFIKALLKVSARAMPTWNSQGLFRKIGQMKDALVKVFS
jgi:hypothetical protein